MTGRAGVGGCGGSKLSCDGRRDGDGDILPRVGVGGGFSDIEFLLLFLQNFLMVMRVERLAGFAGVGGSAPVIESAEKRLVAVLWLRVWPSAAWP